MNAPIRILFGGLAVIAATAGQAQPGGSVRLVCTEHMSVGFAVDDADKWRPARFPPGVSYTVRPANDKEIAKLFAHLGPDAGPVPYVVIRDGQDVPQFRCQHGFSRQRPDGQRVASDVLACRGWGLHGAALFDLNAETLRFLEIYRIGWIESPPGGPQNRDDTPSITIGSCRISAP